MQDRRDLAVPDHAFTVDNVERTLREAQILTIDLVLPCDVALRLKSARSGNAIPRTAAQAPWL